MKTGVIDVGGGMRGVYATGVFDRCMDDGVNFDLCIGVSAGSANIASFLAGQRGRNYIFYTQYAMREKYMSLRNFILKKSYIDLDYVYGTLSNSDGENPIDYAAFAANPAQFLVVAANALTGEARYFDKSDISLDHYDVFKASCSIPVVCHPYFIDGVPYYDGALADPVPVKKAFDMGCDKVVLILTKPRSFIRTADKDARLTRFIRKKYPAAAEGMEKRAQNYNDGVALAKEYEEQGRLIIIAPDDTCGVDTLTRDKTAMDNFYKKGLSDGAAVSAFLK